VQLPLHSNAAGLTPLAPSSCLRAGPAEPEMTIRLALVREPSTPDAGQVSEYSPYRQL
jgi:hypothetical protein